MLLTMKEEAKLEVIQRFMDGQFMIKEASKLLGVSSRTIYRLLSKVRLRGVKGIIHGNRGNKHALKMDENKKNSILKLAKKYKGFNDTHMREKLVEREDIKISREGLRQILRGAGISPKRRRRSRKYRSRRARKESFGMMIQIDASIHDWLEGRGSKLTLVGGVDDATGHAWARFEKSESTWAYLHLLRQIIVDKGIPMSIYSDRHTIFHSTKEASIMDQLQNRKSRTQFGKAMERLGIKLIKAWSPQAKGRVERAWGTFQDRLVAEMSFAGISDKKAANDFLKNFLKDYNMRFTCKPTNKKNCFRKRPHIQVLDRTLCIKDIRTVAKDHTISLDGIVFQIPPNKKWRSIAGQKVHILQLRDGSIEIEYKKLIVARFEYEKVVKIVKNCGFTDDHILIAA